MPLLQWQRAYSDMRFMNRGRSKMNLTRIKEVMREPIYENWKPNEIVRPVSVGFYFMLVTIAGTYLLVSLFP